MAAGPLIGGLLIHISNWRFIFYVNQNVLHYTSIMAGLAFVPLTIGFVITNLLSGRIINRFGIGASLVGGLIIFAAGFAGLFLAGDNTPYWQLFFPF